MTEVRTRPNVEISTPATANSPTTTPTTTSAIMTSAVSQRRDSLSNAGAPRSPQPTPQRQPSQYSPRNPTGSGVGAVSTSPAAAAATAAEQSVDSAVQFLERRRSNDASASQRRNSYYSQIQPDLYRRRGSIISIASSFSSTHSTSPTSAAAAASGGGGGTASSSEKATRSPRVGAEIVGRAQLQLSYDFSKSDFIVQLIEASIQPSLLRQDEYQLQLSLRYVDAPENDNPVAIKRRAVHKTEKAGHLTANGERFKFATSYEELLQQVLTMELTSLRKNTASSPIIVPHAKTSVALSLLNPSDDELLIWLDLEAVKEVEDTCGELNVCLQFLPSAARLTLTVHQAINLPAKTDGLPNTFVRASLIQDDKVILKKRKTNVRKASVSPSWNEVLTFGVTQSAISRCRLEVTVMECDRFGNNSRPLGRINFSSTRQSSGHGSAGGPNAISIFHMWRETTQGRNVALPQWLPLEPISAQNSS